MFGNAILFVFFFTLLHSSNQIFLILLFLFHCFYFFFMCLWMWCRCRISNRSNCVITYRHTKDMCLCIVSTLIVLSADIDDIDRSGRDEQREETETYYYSLYYDHGESNDSRCYLIFNQCAPHIHYLNVNLFQKHPFEVDSAQRANARVWMYWWAWHDPNSSFSRTKNEKRERDRKQESER